MNDSCFILIPAYIILHGVNEDLQLPEWENGLSAVSFQKAEL